MMFLKISQNPQENLCCICLFLNKVAGLRPIILLKKKLQHRCFPVNIANLKKHIFHRKPPDDCFWLFIVDFANEPCAEGLLHVNGFYSLDS